MKKGICKFCSQTKELCKSHIIPRSFYLDYKIDKYKAINPENGAWKQIQSGVYDATILCEECETFLSQLDTVGNQILLQDVYNHVEKQDGKNTLYILREQEFNYSSLKKFIVSLLWRASISNKPDFISIDLGKYQDIALNFIKGEPINDNLFKIIFFKVPLTGHYSRLTYIQRFKFYRITSYKILMASYEIIVIPNYSIMPSCDKEYFKHLFLSPAQLCILESNDIHNGRIHFLHKTAKKWRKCIHH